MFTSSCLLRTTVEGTRLWTALSLCISWTSIIKSHEVSWTIDVYYDNILDLRVCVSRGGSLKLVRQKLFCSCFLAAIVYCLKKTWFSVAKNSSLSCSSFFSSLNRNDLRAKLLLILSQFQRTQSRVTELYTLSGGSVWWKFTSWLNRTILEGILKWYHTPRTHTLMCFLQLSPALSFISSY